MTDPTEEALRAIERKYLPLVMDGKSLLPMYPREDVAVMIEAAVAAEREACAKIADDASPTFASGPAAEGQRMTSAQVAAAIRARG